MNKPDHAEDELAPLSYRGARRILWLVVLLIISAFVLHSLQSVLLLFAIVFLLAMVLNPLVVWLEKHRIPRVAAVLLVMLALIAIAATVILFAIPPLASQVEGLDVETLLRDWARGTAAGSAEPMEYAEAFRRFFPFH